MDKRIRLTALTLAASLLLNMVVLPVHAEEEAAPSAIQMSQENEPTEGPTAAATVPAETTAPATTPETTAAAEETASTETAEETTAPETTEPETTQATIPEETETDPELSLMEDVPVPVNNTYTIYSYLELVALSTQVDASEYADSTIKIYGRSGSPEAMKDFKGLGNAQNPFRGKLVFGTDTEANLILYSPLFRYLSTQAEITIESSTNGGYLQLTDKSQEGALLAEVLVGEGGSPKWKIIAYNLQNTTGEDTQEYTVPIIGTMKSGSSVTLSIKDGYLYPVKAANAGRLCGTMEENTQLTLEDYESIAEKTTDYLVKASSGAAGGLVGKMGKGAELTVKPDLSFPEKIIDASGNAGDLVGEMGENATLTVAGKLTCAGTVKAGSNAGSLVGQMGKNAQLNVAGELAVNTTSVNGGGSAGGLVGRMAEGAELSLPKIETVGAAGFTVSGKNAGGLVGEMKDARLSGLSKTEIKGTVTASQNAGGLVGVAENLILDGKKMPSVSATKITGSTTAGGLIGSYTYSRADDEVYNGEDYPAVTVDLSGSGGNVGGLYGYVKNTAGDFYLKGTQTVTVTAANGSSLGGLLGKYEANALTGQSLYVNTGTVSLNANGGDSYGGIIGSVTGGNGVYIEVQKAAPVRAATGNAGNNVGGLIGKLEGGGHMVRILGATVSGAQGGSASGGLVGYMQNGVLYLGANITIEQPGSGGMSGWVLGNRDNTLVYTDQNWNPRKGTTNDIGGWGQVVRANNLPGVLTYDPDERTVTVAEPTLSGTSTDYRVSNGNDFAKLALRYQLNETHSLKFESGDLDLNATQTIQLNANVNYLEDIGFTSFQRDVNNAAEANVILKGNVNGRACTVTLPGIPIYTGGTNHDRQGLFTKTANLTADNVTVDGAITVQAGSALYIGALCAETTGTAKLTKVVGSTKINLDAQDNSTYSLWGTRVSGLLGTAMTADFTQCTWNGTIVDTTKSVCYLGGFYARGDRGKEVITVTDCTVSGSIEKKADNVEAAVGGLIASLTGYDQTLTINGLNVDGLDITTGSNSVSGGLLGYEWLNTTATITGVTVKNSVLYAGTNARFGGLVYAGSGYWNVKKGGATASEPYGIHFASGNRFTGKSTQDAPSGLIVAKGEKNGNTALYLEIREDAYKAEGTTVDIGGSQYFDEIVGSNRADNANGIVSIALPGHALIDRNECSTYKSQLGQPWKNGNTRYYYNLDDYRDALGKNAETGAVSDSPDFGTAVDTAPKMMLWNAYHDCDTGLRKYFSAQNGGFVISGDINLGGYSFYPTYYINDTSIQGASITFDYDTMNNLETGASNKPLNQTTSQHYQMHTGIFSGGKAEEKQGQSVNDQTLTVRNLTLAGTVGRSATGFGALCCGPFSGSSPYARMYLDIEGVNLAGIRISENTNDADPVRPLLIYSLGSYTNLDMSGVTTSTGYEDMNTDSTKYAASSLIGKVGDNTAKEIHLTFKEMKLDGRPGRGTSGPYHTTGCIFSRALFLESFDYVESSSGTYNFTKAEKDACTLGRELSNSSAGTAEVRGRNNDEQRWYYGGKLTNDLVCGKTNDYRTWFVPYQRYVYQPEDLTTTGSTHHELDINLNTAGLEVGCGTRTDPYIITEFSQLKTLNQVLRDGTAENWPVNLDPDVLANVRNKASFEDTDEHTRANVNGGHVKYEYTAENGWMAADNSTVTSDEMRTYLQNAYYKLDADIEADSSWEGLGHADATDQKKDRILGFSGVIDGDGHTFATPGSTASQFGGLVKYSMGCVIQNITVRYTGNVSVTCNQVPSDKISPAFFGGVVGWCRGGDTILKNVTVENLNAPAVSGTYDYLASVGGFVGMVGGSRELLKTSTSGTGEEKWAVSFGGGVVFQGTISGGLADGKAAGNSHYFYFNPYVGRVLDGYAMAEGSLKLDNTDKNYTIPTISGGTHLTRDGSTVTVKDAQGLWLLSAIANSGAATMKGNKTREDNLIKALYAAYSYGRPRKGTTDDADLGGVAKLKTGSYLDKFADGDTYDLTRTAITLILAGNCDMSGYGNGFRGIGNSYGAHTGGDNYRFLQISAVNGSGYTVTLNQNRQEYDAEKENWTSIGSGLFVQMRLPDNDKTLTVSDLTLTGRTGITYYRNSARKSNQGEVLATDYLWDVTHRVNMVSSGMLANAFIQSDKGGIVTVSRVHLNSAKVNPDSVGTMVAGGLVGAMGTGENLYYRPGDDQSGAAMQTVTLTDCTYSDLEVNALSEAGGLVGFLKSAETTIYYNEDAELKNGTIRATRQSCLIYDTSKGVSGQRTRQDVGGLIGMTDRYRTNCRLDILAADNCQITLSGMEISAAAGNNHECNVGGLVGLYLVGGNTAQANPSRIRGVRLENSVKLYNSNTGGIFTNIGGLCGFISDDNLSNWNSSGTKFYLEFSDITIGTEDGSQVLMYKARQMGGLVALCKNPGGSITIHNVSVGSQSSTVFLSGGNPTSSDCIAGGLLGVVCLSSNIYTDNIRLVNTTVLGRRAAGGLVGQNENKSGTPAAIELKNLAMEGCTIGAYSYAWNTGIGGIYGILTYNKVNMTGYNVLFKDNVIGYVLNANGNGLAGSLPNAPDANAKYGLGKYNGNYRTFAQIAGDTGYVDNQVGIFGGWRQNNSTQPKKIQFVGVSLQQTENTVPMRDFPEALDLEKNEYLVRADYTGVQENKDANKKYPYVTTNPVSPLTELLDGLLNQDEKVTGDGASFVGSTSAPIGEKIRSDSSGTENRNLTHTAVEEARKYLTDTETNRPADMAYFGSFTGDGDNGGYTGGNFPVFVISTTSTDEANRALYSALSLLTNRVMYGETITHDLDPAPPTDMTLSLTNYVYSGGRWQVSQEDGSFTLEANKRIRLNGQYDNQKARFTLLKADFANPADASQTVYTLYLPVMIKKVFNFRFWASALTGTSYIQSNYDDLNRLAIASDNEKVTALVGFDYTRTREEWQKAVDDGENLMWNFLKQIRLNVELPAATRLVLVDRNNQDKAWYATAANALEQVDSYYELKFTSFRESLSGTSESWSPVTLSQLLPLTARTLTDAEKADATITGKFVITADKAQATVQIGDTYYRKATDEDKDQTQYAITVGELKGELSERYYLTIQTPADSQQMLNILLTCDDRLTNPAGNGLPTKRLAASDSNPNNGFARNGDENRIIIASCFTQEVSLTTAVGQLEMISDSNTQVEARVTATIQFKDAESAQRFQNYAGDQSLSQCFNLVFYRYENGTKTRVNLTPGTQITAEYHYGTESWKENYIVDTATRAYRLTLPTQIPCSDIREHAVEITADLTLDFASSYVDQFPTRESDTDRTGILMAVSSTLSYTPQTLTSSTLSTQPPSEDTRDRHFYRGEVSVATLNYDATGETEMDSINQLGINGFEGSSARLLSAASYNVSAVSRTENAKYLRCTLTLSPRNNTGTSPFVSYGAAVPWGKCLTGEKLKLSLNYTAEDRTVVTAANPTNTEDNVNATYTATFQLDSVLDKNVPLEISADMSLLAGTALEANGMTYANYKIRLEVELLDAGMNTINGSNASDYLVYTNSRIYKNIVPRT